jgi:hypothetical protein
MARQHRNMEGDENQRRQAAREARAEGKRPSEVGATLGASKQRKHAKQHEDDHSTRLAQRHEGKQQDSEKGKPRPGNRDVDPKRTNRWG